MIFESAKVSKLTDWSHMQRSHASSYLFHETISINWPHFEQFLMFLLRNLPPFGLIDRWKNPTITLKWQKGRDFNRTSNFVWSDLLRTSTSWIFKSLSPSRDSCFVSQKLLYQSRMPLAKTRTFATTLRTGTRAWKIRDGEDIDVLRSPASDNISGSFGFPDRLYLE